MPEGTRLLEIGGSLLVFFLISVGILAGIAILILYIRTLRRALERCCPASRAMSPDAVWLLLIPIFSAVWRFFVVFRLATSLGNEFKHRKVPNADREPGRTVGLAMCVLPLVILLSAVAGAGALQTLVRGVLAGASVVCWLAYWVKIAAVSKALATPHEAGVTEPASAKLRPDLPYLLIGIAGLCAFFLLIPLTAAVVYLIPGLPGGTTKAAEPYAVVYPHWYSRLFAMGEMVSQDRVEKLARRQLQQQRYPDSPMILGLIEQRIGQQLVGQQVLLAEAERLGIHATSDDVCQYLQTGAPGQVIFPNGQFIGDDKYAALIQKQFNLSATEFNEEVRNDLVVHRLEALITAGVTVSDQEVRDEYRKSNMKIRFDYAVISADDLSRQINPADSQLEKFFKTNAARYASAVPEERRITYFAFTANQLPGGVPQPSQQEIQQYFNAHQADYSVPEQARSRHILILVAAGADAATDAAARAKAEGILKQIQGGANFAELAKKYSDDPGSKDKGGELGFYRRGTLVPEFEEAIFKQKIGDIEIVKSQYGYHIIQVEERQAAHSKPLSDVQPVIQATLIRQKTAQAEEDYAQALTKDATKNGLEKTAAAHQLELATTPPVTSQGAIAALPNGSLVVAKAFESKQGDPPQAAPTGEGYAIFQVTGIVAAHAPNFEDWKSHVLEDYREQVLPPLLNLQTHQLADKAKAENNLAKAAKEEGATLKASDLVSFSSQVPDLGQVARVAPQLFDLAVGQISGPIDAGRTGVVAKLVDKQEPSADEIAKNLNQAREQLLEQRRSNTFSVFLSGAIDRYKKNKRIRLSAKAQGPGMPGM
ncbi:MAG: peptidylprolyl isomerase [Terracidiphilus sp.]